MSQKPTRSLIRIFLSSPGDVADERGIARNVIKALGDDPLLGDRVICQAVAWDDPDSRSPVLQLSPRRKPSIRD